MTHNAAYCINRHISKFLVVSLKPIWTVIVCQGGEHLIYGPTWRKDMAGRAQPPMKMTVVMAMTHVVVKKSCRTVVTVFRTASAKAMAPRRPENQSMC